MRKKYYWEDFKTNEKISLGFKSISNDEIIDFAKQFKSADGSFRKEDLFKPL